MERSQEGQKELHEFWAVTEKGAYHASAARGHNGCPLVIKIAEHKKGGNCLPIGTTLKDGYFLGISTQGLCLYNEGRVRLAETRDAPDSPEVRRCGRTSAIVALFLKEKDARDCSNRIRGGMKVSTPDGHWLDQTLDVLDRIGDRHTVFVLSKGEHGLREALWEKMGGRPAVAA